MRSVSQKNPLLKIVNDSLLLLPTPSNISVMWNFGSLLGLCLVVQLGTGVFLSMHYCMDTETAFFSVSHIMRDINWGWLVRIIHSNGASAFFMFIYLHLSRNLYYESYKLSHVWTVGVSILLALMAIAFLGYVLPWGQMSFWGATVITNLFSAIPYFGTDIVYWLWGGFSVSSPTLSRFFALHFFLPFILAGMVLIHLLFLHQHGSSNPLGVSSNALKIAFGPYFLWKDIVGFVLYFVGFLTIVLIFPWVFGDTVNFVMANPLVTPVHIQPEWYFLFAYAILRSIPNKLGGVLGLLLSVLVLYSLVFASSSKMSSNKLSPFKKIWFWSFVNVFLLLTWIGARPVDLPYLGLGQLLTLLYFSYFLGLLI